MNSSQVRFLSPPSVIVDRYNCSGLKVLINPELSLKCTDILNGEVGVRVAAGEVLSRSADEHVDALWDGLQLDIA